MASSYLCHVAPRHLLIGERLASVCDSSRRADCGDGGENRLGALCVSCLRENGLASTRRSRRRMATDASSSRWRRTGSGRFENRSWQSEEKGKRRELQMARNDDDAVSRHLETTKKALAGEGDGLLAGNASPPRKSGIYGVPRMPYRLWRQQTRGEFWQRRILSYVAYRMDKHMDKHRMMTGVSRASSADMGNTMGYVQAEVSGSNEGGLSAAADDTSTSNPGAASSYSSSSSSSSSSSFSSSLAGTPTTALGIDDTSDVRPGAALANETHRDPGGKKIASPPPSKAISSSAIFGAASAAVIGAVAVALFLRANSAAFAANSWIALLSRSGFAAAFSLIFVSEIGDKTFFIAALLAMRHSRWPVLIGASGALGLMTIISVAIGRLFHKVPSSFHTTVPIGEYLAVALLIWFGLKSIKDAWDMPSPVPAAGQVPDMVDSGEAGEGRTVGGGGGGGGELEEAEEFLNTRKESVQRFDGPFGVLLEAFCLVFVAEWGDRSMLATIALGAAQSPVGVAVGATLGHIVATGIAVVGGGILANYISEKLVSYIGGVLFLVFAAATVVGVF
ncbi:hypothetical protein CBR_g12688 [Chara braunii]|uniref:GDT1 family protein n=1 Tax=Chara braunii TaxID=69332 RepID=A0A388KSF4_CHABU|nr:hypothetical protein CBR_g12688 [Chara braunii]|eukprot:GBG72969.1 hypothetical protein CBR_g12688 [Chara braunii]